MNKVSRQSLKLILREDIYSIKLISWRQIDFYTWARSWISDSFRQHCWEISAMIYSDVFFPRDITKLLLNLRGGRQDLANGLRLMFDWSIYSSSILGNFWIIFQIFYKRTNVPEFEFKFVLALQTLGFRLQGLVFCAASTCQIYYLSWLEFFFLKLISWYKYRKIVTRETSC